MTRAPRPRLGLACALVLAAHAALPAAATRLDDRRFALFGFACNYDWRKMYHFARTLRATGFAGPVELAVDAELDGETRRFLRDYNITGNSEPCAAEDQAEEPQEPPPSAGANTTGADPAPQGGRNQVRYNYYEQWLRRSDYTHVWLVDVKDVIFLAHPFSWLTPAAEDLRNATSCALLRRADLAFFEEYEGLNAWAAARVRCVTDDATLKRMKKHYGPNMCAGTVYATREGALRLCRVMQDILQRAHRRDFAGCARNDQPLVNFALWSYGMSGTGSFRKPALGEVAKFARTGAPVMTLHEAGDVARGEVADEPNRFAAVAARLVELGPGKVSEWAEDPIVDDEVMVHKWYRDRRPNGLSAMVARDAGAKRAGGFVGWLRDALHRMW